jgi:hypothetical protein
MALAAELGAPVADPVLDGPPEPLPDAPRELVGVGVGVELELEVPLLVLLPSSKFAQDILVLFA